MKLDRSSAAALLLSLTVGLLCAFPAQKNKNSQQAPPPRTEPRADPLEAWLAQAEEALGKKDFAGAIEALQKYIERKPEDALAHFQLGFAYTGLKQWESAKAEYSKAIELDSKLAAAHLNLGLLLLERDPSAALPPLSKAAELLPDQARPRLLLGTALERSHRLEAALEQYQAAQRLEPNNQEIHFALARALLASKRPAEAETEWNKVLELRPNSTGARLGLAESLIAQSKFEAAASALAAYLELQPQDQESRIQLASVYLDLERFDQALRELERAEKVGPTSLAVQKLRAEIYLHQKRFPEAAEALQQALALEPSNAELRARLGRLWLEKREFAAAERELRHALRMNPNLTDALRDLVAVYYLGQNCPAALETLSLLAQREAPTAGSWFVRATCHDKLGMKAEALAAYERFLVLDRGENAQQNFQARQRIRILTRELKK